MKNIKLKGSKWKQLQTFRIKNVTLFGFKVSAIWTYYKNIWTKNNLHLGKLYLDSI